MAKRGERQPRRKGTEVQDKAIEMYLDGIPVANILEEMSIARSTLYIWLRESGIDSRVRKVEREFGVSVMALLDEITAVLIDDIAMLSETRIRHRKQRREQRQSLIDRLTEGLGVQS